MIAIVIPAYNEEKTIADIVRKTKKYGSVIVVDDASTDGTSRLAYRCGAMVIKHERNMGLGVSLRDGFKKALEMKADIIITMDADGQHEPTDIPKFIDKINEGYDFVLGRRNLRMYPFRKRFGNFFLNLFTNFISGTVLRDTESGFRAFRRKALEKLHLRAERYEIAVEIIFEIGRKHIKSANVDVKSDKYVRGVGVLDGFKNLSYLLHRRKRNIKSYIEDFKYVVRNWID